MIRLKVKEVAQQKGISQGLLGRKANLDKNTLRGIYQHPYDVVKTDTLNKLANALGVSPCELLEYTPDAPTWN